MTAKVLLADEAPVAEIEELRHLILHVGAEPLDRGELGPVGLLVQAHPEPEVPWLDVEVPLGGDDVGGDQQQPSDPAPGRRRRRPRRAVAPHVDKVRYNPGHLHHVERHKSVRDKVAWLVGVARDTDCAIRIGVNCGSVDPAKDRKSVV